MKHSSYSSSVSNQIFPLACSTMLLHMARPRPVPDDLVVKLGMNILDCISGGMPSPLSFTLIRTVPSIHLFTYFDHAVNSFTGFNSIGE